MNLGPSRPEESNFAMNADTPENPFSRFSVRATWLDLRDALSALCTPALIVFLILFALNLVRWRITPLNSLTGGLVLEDLFYEAVNAFLMTPYAIAVHRFIILGERTMSYRIAPAEPRFRRFFGWSLALSVLAYEPATIVDMLPGSTSLTFLLTAVLGIAAFVVGIRVIVLFPAIAVDAPGANWRHALADTEGHAWDIFFVILVAMLPFVIVMFVAAVAVVLLRAIVGDDVVAHEDFHAAYGAIMRLLSYTLAVVIASRLYQWIGIKVREGD